MEAFTPLSFFLALMALFWTFVFKSETAKDIRHMQKTIYELESKLNKTERELIDRIYKEERRK